MPSVADTTEAEALELLGRFEVDVQRQNDESIPAGSAIGTEPPEGTPQPPDTAVTLFVSNGPAPVEIPNVQGASFDAAARSSRRRGSPPHAVRTSSATPSPRTR